jgi:uncharacterized protein
VIDAIRSGYPIDAVDERGNTLFIVACQNGQRKIAQLAVDSGADMNKQNIGGNTGLHFLYAFGYRDIASYFESRGASTSITNKLGKVPSDGIK